MTNVVGPERAKDMVCGDGSHASSLPLLITEEELEACWIAEQYAQSFRDDLAVKLRAGALVASGELSLREPLIDSGPIVVRIAGAELPHSNIRERFIQGVILLGVGLQMADTDINAIITSAKAILG